MTQISSITPLQGEYSTQEKPVLVLAHDQRKSIIPIMYMALGKIKRSYGDTVYKEFAESWDSEEATNESVLKDVFNLFEVRVCDFKESPIFK